MSLYQKIVVCNFTEEELREIWRDTYCHKVIKTHDGIRVHFYESNFDHAFYESSKRNQSRIKKKSKDILSSERLSRILWIKDVLEDPTATMYVGFDNKTKRYDRTKRVAVVKGNYVVVIQIYAEGKANFITAYVANNSIEKIEQSPRW
jgi:similarity